MNEDKSIGNTVFVGKTGLLVSHRRADAITATRAEKTEVHHFKMKIDSFIGKYKITMLAAWLFCIMFNHISAQTVWNKTFIEDRPVLLFSSVIKVDSIYHIIGTTGESGVFSSYDRIFIGKLNDSGNLVSHQIIYDSVLKGYSAFLNALIKNDKNELVYTGYSTDSIMQVIVLKKNLLTDSLSIWEYSTPNASVFFGCKVIQYGSDYFIAGVRTDQTVNSADNFLMKIDSNGNRLWQKYYGVSNRLEFPRSLTILNSGNLLIGSYRTDFDQTNEHANTWLFEVDTAGNMVRQWFDPNDSTYVAEGLLQTHDGGFIYGAQKKFLQSINDVYKVGTILKMDSAFNKQWTFVDGRYSETTGIYDIEELQDGSFVGCGNKPFYDGDSSMISGWVIKLSATGNVLWNRTYAGLQTSFSFNYLTDIDVMPNGDLIAVGQCQNSNQQPSQVGWFLKLDSNGCEVENCLVGMKEVEVNKGEMKIYPNPANTTVQTEMSVQGEYEIQLVNVTGQLIEKRETTRQTEIFTTENLSNGVYFLKVTDKKNVSYFNVQKFIVQH